MMSFRYLAMIVCSLCSLYPAFAFTRELTPFATSNQSPLVRLYGLPATAPGTILDEGITSLALRADIASLCSRSRSGSESILLDGESYRFSLAASRGIGRDFEIGMEIPYVMYRGGGLDTFISNWHDFFKLPQGDRDKVPEDQLDYDYSRNGSTELQLDGETEGFGDLRLLGGWRILGPQQGRRSSLSIRASLKLPTGNQDKLLGSGSTDVAFWLSGSDFYREGTVALFGSVGVLFMSDGDILAQQQRNYAAFGSIGTAWQAFDVVAFKLQIDGHTGIYESTDLSELGSSLQLIIGGTIDITSTTTLDLGVAEDIVVDSAPDVVFHLALHTRF